MYKQISLIVATLLVFSVGNIVGNSKHDVKPHTVVTRTQPVSDNDQAKFRDKLMSELNKAQAQTAQDYKENRTPTSSYAPMFQQNVASTPDANTTTFSPKIDTGGLNFNGKAFAVTVENGSNKHNSSYVITGKITPNGSIANVKVDAL